MNDTTVNDLVLYEEAGKFMWVREGASTPQGWNPVTRSEWTVDISELEGKHRYEVEVNFEQE